MKGRRNTGIKHDSRAAVPKFVRGVSVASLLSFAYLPPDGTRVRNVVSVYFVVAKLERSRKF